MRYLKKYNYFFKQPIYKQLALEWQIDKATFRAQALCTKQQ